MQQIAIDKIITSVLLEGESRYTVQPLLSFIRPEVEGMKKRSEQRDVFLDFPVSGTVIVSSYMNNPRELANIQSMLDELSKDKNLNVNSVGIKGYASPEGSSALNNNLSRGRAEALRSYLVSNSTFPAGVYNVEQGGEDWEGLERLVEGGYLGNKNEVLAVIRSGRSEDAREQLLKPLGGGNTYKVLLTEFYPRLRRVLCRVDYTVRGFNVDEAKEIDHVCNTL